MSLLHRGKIQSGTVILSEPVTLPDGTEVVVSIEPVETAAGADVSATTETTASLPIIGIWKDREDMSDSAAWVRKEREAWEQRLARRD